MKKLDDNTRNAIMGLKSCVISPLDYVELLERRLDDAPANFGEKDAPLENNPFFLNDYEFRILQYRYHLLQALNFEEKRGKWQRIDDNGYICPIDNELIKTATDEQFLDAIEATGVNVDFKLK